MDATLIIVVMVGFVLLVLLVHEVTSVDRALTRRAHHDYAAARGTQHKQQLQHCLDALKSRRGQVEAEGNALKSRVSALDGRCRGELTRILVNQVVRSRLGEVRGLGPSLVAEILGSCFDGNLRSLHRAHNIRGIGNERQAAISAWVRRIEGEIPYLLEMSFPGKAEVTARYEGERREIEAGLAKSADELSRLGRMEERAMMAADRLGKVTAGDFVLALTHGTGADSPTVLDHLRGLFAEWEPVPTWYSELLEEFGK